MSSDLTTGSGIYMVNGPLFWEITVQGASFVVRSGRRWQGKETDIQTQETSFETPEAAIQRATDLLGSKVVNGYKILVSPQTSPSPQRPQMPCVIVEEWRCVREERPGRPMGWVQRREVIDLEEDGEVVERGWRGGRVRRRAGRYFY
jgi:predicted DNA-binding WGR domain protein